MPKLLSSFPVPRSHIVVLQYCFFPFCCFVAKVIASHGIPFTKFKITARGNDSKQCLMRSLTDIKPFFGGGGGLNPSCTGKKAAIMCLEYVVTEAES